MPGKNRKEQMTLTAEQQKQVEEKLRQVAADGRIQCAAALGIAKTLGVPSKEVGMMADHLNFRICKCQLNCF